MTEGRAGGKQLYLQPKVRVGMCSNISEHLQHHMCEYFTPSFPEDKINQTYHVPELDLPVTVNLL